MKDVRPIRGRHHIQSLIEQGEHEHQDFKFAISDARKIARSLSAFANHEGGRLLVGVKDNGVIAGIRDEGDIYMIEYAAERYCRPAIDVRFTAYNVGDGLVVLKAEVQPHRPRPVTVDEGAGRHVAYIRVHDENITVPDIMLRAWQYASDGMPLLTLDGPERHILDIITAAGTDGTDADHVARACHLSQARAADIISRLAAMDLIQFIHRDATFKLVIS